MNATRPGELLQTTPYPDPSVDRIAPLASCAGMRQKRPGRPRQRERAGDSRSRSYVMGRLAMGGPFRRPAPAQSSMSAMQHVAPNVAPIRSGERKRERS